MKRPTKIDPSRTSTLRRALSKELRRRFAKFKLQVQYLIVRENALGLTQNAFCPTGEGGGVDPTCAPGSSSGIILSLKSFGAKFAHMEHVAKSYAVDGIGALVKKLPEKLQVAVHYTYAATKLAAAGAFATWTAGQAFAERVAKERGYTDEEARRLRGVLSATDIVTMKPIQLGLAATGMKALALPASFVPPATAAYLAYSTAKNPLATVKAAAKAVASMAQRYVLSDMGTMNSADPLVDALQEHKFDDWYIALLSCAMDATGSVPDAIELANKLYTTENTRWAVDPQSDQVMKFQKWMKQQVKDIPGKEDAWVKYVKAGYMKGAGRAFDDANKGKGSKKSDDFYAGGKSQFLKSSFGQPVAVEKVKFLAARTYTDLEGITDAMSAKMVRSLADGLTQGKSPLDIAKDLVDDVNGIGVARAETLARTEIVRAHAEGQLDALEAMGIEEVEANVEWSTAGDEKVCAMCEPLEGAVFSIAEARGLLPRHPNCRCAWMPAVDVEPKSEKKVLKSLDAGAWNMFCPTGPGGGVDPTCTKDGGGAAAPQWSVGDKVMIPGKEHMGKLRVHMVQKGEYVIDKGGGKFFGVSFEDAHGAVPAPAPVLTPAFAPLPTPKPIKPSVKGTVKGFSGAKVAVPDEPDAKVYEAKDYKPTADVSKSFTKLSAEQKKAVAMHTGSTTGAVQFEEFNQKLKAGEANPADNHYAVLLQSSMAKFKEPVPVYRGLNEGGDRANYDKLIDKLTVSIGKGTVTMNGFASSTIDPSVAASFAKPNGTDKEGAVIHIQAKRGVWATPNSDYKHQKEVILDHATKYRVVSKTRGKFEVDGKHIYRDVFHLEEV